MCLLHSTRRAKSCRETKVKKGNACTKRCCCFNYKSSNSAVHAAPLQCWPFTAGRTAGAKPTWKPLLTSVSNIHSDGHVDGHIQAWVRNCSPTQTEGQMFDSMFCMSSGVEEIACFKMFSTSTWEFAANHSNSTYLCKVGTQSCSFRRESLTNLQKQSSRPGPSYSLSKSSRWKVSKSAASAAVLTTYAMVKTWYWFYGHDWMLLKAPVALCGWGGPHAHLFLPSFDPFSRPLLLHYCHSCRNQGKSGTVKGATGRIRCLPALTICKSNTFTVWWKPDVTPSPFWPGIELVEPVPLLGVL